MDTDLIKTFVDVVRRGSFASVAKDRNVAPSSISRAIAALEDELGLRLFQRTTRKMCPTEAGDLFFELIEPLLNGIERAKQSALDLSGRAEGTLKVTTSVSFGQKCVVPLMAEFSKLYPGLSVELLLDDGLVDIVAERYDLALRLGRLQDSSLVAHRLLSVRYVVCASSCYLDEQGCPAHPEQLSMHNCLRFPFAGFRSRWIFRSSSGELKEVPISGNGVYSTALALEQCALSGMGITMLPDWLVVDHLRQGRLINLFPAYEVTATDFDAGVWIVYASRSYVPRKVRIFTDFLKARLGGGVEDRRVQDDCTYLPHESVDIEANQPSTSMVVASCSCSGDVAEEV